MGNGNGEESIWPFPFPPPWKLFDYKDGWEVESFKADPRVKVSAQRLRDLSKQVYEEFLKLETIEGEHFRVMERKYSKPMPSGGGHMEAGHPMTFLDKAHWSLNEAVQQIYKRLGLKFEEY